MPASRHQAWIAVVLLGVVCLVNTATSSSMRFSRDKQQRAAWEALLLWCGKQHQNEPPDKRVLDSYGKKQMGLTVKYVNDACSLFPIELENLTVYSKFSAPPNWLYMSNGKPAVLTKPVRIPSISVIVKVNHGHVDVIQAGLVYSTTRRVYSFQKWFYQGQFPRATASNVVHVPGGLYSLITQYSTFYQHDVFDVLPRLAIGMKMLLQDLSIKVLAPSIKCAQLIEALGIASSRIITIAVTNDDQVADVIYTADDVFLPQFVGHKGQKPPMGMMPKGILGPFRETLAGELWRSTPPLSVVYLQRPHDKVRGMDVANERALLELIKSSLKDEYNLIVFHSTGDWRIDRKVFAAATVVLGPHGGAEANIVFCPPNTSVIEFNPMVQIERQSGNFRPCYLGLAAACDLKFWIVEPISGFHFEKLPGIVIDPQEVLSILKSLDLVKV
eukprot:m.267117 g.267117  ORF g.267117 m.267117 type:complete len:443 (+) comp71161_c0_seq1:346-1674(+)